jgi:hypothetical protein
MCVRNLNEMYNIFLCVKMKNYFKYLGSIFRGFYLKKNIFCGKEKELIILNGGF